MGNGRRHLFSRPCSGLVYVEAVCILCRCLYRKKRKEIRRAACPMVPRLPTFTSVVARPIDPHVSCSAIAVYFFCPPVLNKTRPARATEYPNTWMAVMVDPKARTEPEMRSCVAKRYHEVIGQLRRSSRISHKAEDRDSRYP